MLNPLNNSLTTYKPHLCIGLQGTKQYQTILMVHTISWLCFGAPVSEALLGGV